MYAIIETGGKQYRVEQNDIIEVELLKSENEKIEFKQVLLLNDDKNSKVGMPYIDNCIVYGQILDQTKGPKVIAYKYRKRKDSKKKIGHRQKYSKVQITEIKAS